MRIDVECIPCFVRQARETVCRVTSDDTLRWRVMREVCALVDGVTTGLCPPQFAEQVYDVVASVTGIADPFVAEKRLANELALAIEPRLRDVLAISSDPLLEAIKFAIAGNSMDLGVVQQYGDVGALADSILAAPLGVDDYPSFRDRLSTARRVLVVGDNNGELVFDRLLIEEMQKERPCRYTYMVRGRPVINDVTREDALSVGMDRIAEIAVSGAGSPGLVLSACGEDALRLFMQADMVVAKGQGNYEALSDAPRDVFFLLMVKCDVVSRDLQAPVGVAVVKHRRRE
jgi:damage-control phosphatase, subfamily I